jgi:hypothetical protein
VLTEPDGSAYLYSALKERLQNSDKQGAIELYEELLRSGRSVGEILNTVGHIQRKSDQGETATAEYPQSGFERVATGITSEAALVDAAQAERQRTPGLSAELTHEKPKVEPDARSGSCETSPALKGAVVSKPRRAVAERTQLLERSHALPLGLSVPHNAESCGTEAPAPQAAESAPLDELGSDDWEQLPCESLPGSDSDIVGSASAHTCADRGVALPSGEQKPLWPGYLPSIAKRIAFWALYTVIGISVSIAGFSILHGGRDAEPTTTGIHSDISSGTEAVAIPGSATDRSEAVTKLLIPKNQIGTADPSHAPKPLPFPEPDSAIPNPVQKVEVGVRDAGFAGQPEAEASQESEAGQLDVIEQLIEQLNLAAAAPPQGSRMRKRLSVMQGRKRRLMAAD